MKTIHLTEPRSTIKSALILCVALVCLSPVVFTIGCAIGYALEVDELQKVEAFVTANQELRR